MDFTQLLKVMIDRGASDMFITAGARPAIKVDGTIKPLTRETLTPDQAKSLVYSTMNDKQLAEFEDTRECNFAIGKCTCYDDWTGDDCGCKEGQTCEAVVVDEALVYQPGESCPARQSGAPRAAAAGGVLTAAALVAVGLAARVV